MRPGAIPSTRDPLLKADKTGKLRHFNPTLALKARSELVRTIRPLNRSPGAKIGSAAGPLQFRCK
jgi:hypothetical protein